MRNCSSILVALVLLLSAVSTSWCAADCAAKTLTPSPCQHHETVKVCDDPTTTVPDSALPVPTFTLDVVFTTVLAATPARLPSPVGVRTPRPPLRL